MNQARTIIVIGALIFLGIGVFCLFTPRAALGSLGIELLTADAAADARAIYGGLDLAVGCFLLWCVRRPERVYAGAVCMTMTLAGLGLGRAFGLLIEWPHIPLSYTLLAFEAVGAAAGFVAIRLAARAHQR